MPIEEQSAELLKGYQFWPHPTAPTLVVLRLDTQNGRSWVLVTRSLLLQLAEALKEHADQLQEVQ